MECFLLIQICSALVENIIPTKSSGEPARLISSLSSSIASLDDLIRLSTITSAFLLSS